MTGVILFLQALGILWYVPDVVDALRRIACALERIANAAERES